MICNNQHPCGANWDPKLPTSVVIPELPVAYSATFTYGEMRVIHMNYRNTTLYVVRFVDDNGYLRECSLMRFIDILKMHPHNDQKIQVIRNSKREISVVLL